MELLAMTNTDVDEARKAKRLAFMLSQLRADIDELVAGLESGDIDYNTAAAGAKIQLEWVLDQLGESK
jgi:hypothetical protein